MFIAFDERRRWVGTPDEDDALAVVDQLGGMTTGPLRVPAPELVVVVDGAASIERSLLVEPGDKLDVAVRRGDIVLLVLPEGDALGVAGGAATWRDTDAGAVA